MNKKLYYTVDLTSTDQHNGFMPYTLVGDGGEKLCVMYGGASAMLMEMLCRALDNTDPKDYPSPGDIFSRYEKQEGITWKIYRAKGRPQTSGEFVKFKDGKMVERPHWFRDDVEYDIEEQK